MVHVISDLIIIFELASRVCAVSVLHALTREPQHNKLNGCTCLVSAAEWAGLPARIAPPCWQHVKYSQVK